VNSSSAIPGNSHPWRAPDGGVVIGDWKISSDRLLANSDQISPRPNVLGTRLVYILKADETAAEPRGKRASF